MTNHPLPSLAGATSLPVTHAGAVARETVVLQAHGAAGTERLHIFNGAHATTVLRRAPAWTEGLSADAHSPARDALRAPILILVIEVRVIG